MDATFEPGTVLLERYRLGGIIARGGMSVIHEGRDLQEDRAVAIKVLPDELSSPRTRQRFLREARLATQVSHPNVVVSYDAGVLGGRPFLVMEKLDGRTLFHLLRDEGLPTVEEACRIMADVLAGVGAAHACGVVHRDLKPSNVLLLRDGNVKVIDFGLSKDLAPGKGHDITRPHEALGTPSYMSPEQVLVEDVDERTDVYGVGVVAYEMLTGRRAFPKIEGPASEIFKVILEEMPPRPSSIRPEIPPAIDAVVMKAIEKRPEDRFQSTREMLAACGH